MPEPTTEQPLATTAQILFCDLQKGIVAHSKTTSPLSLASAAGALLKLSQLFRLPTITSIVPPGGALIDELTSAGPGLSRMTASLFGNSATATAIAGTGRKTLIVSGFMIEAVVLSTVLDARKQGYEVLVPVDACGSPSQRTEHASLRQMESAGAVTTSVTAIATRLEPDFSTERGQQMFGIVQSIRFDT